MISRAEEEYQRQQYIKELIVDAMNRKHTEDLADSIEGITQEYKTIIMFIAVFFMIALILFIIIAYNHGYAEGYSAGQSHFRWSIECINRTVN